ncbi:MAG: T9SS type A sorting domain-containing protein, partial [Flavobacteriales bacterium]
STLASNLCSGFYQIEVVDERGCLGVSSGNGIFSPVQIYTGTPVEASINTSPGSISNTIVCYGDTSASLSVYNPNPSYSYDWYVDGQYFSSGLSALVPAGDIQVRGLYASCETSSLPVTIYQPSAISISSDLSMVSCPSGSDGSIDITASGGTPSYTYSWFFGGESLGSGTVLDTLTSGVYELSIIDANNCEQLFNIDISEPSILSSVVAVNDVLCNDGSDGSASISLSGATAPYVINWQGEDSTNLSAGSYDVLITDANACSYSIEVVVDEPSALVANFNASTSPFTAQANGGTPSYSYEWLYFGYFESSDSSYSPTESGEYTLVVTDANGCEARVMQPYSSSVGITESASLINVMVYPNPAKDYFTIEVLGDKTGQEYEFQLIDTRARVVMEKKFKDVLKVNREQLSGGIYFISVQSKYLNIKKKLILNE